MSAQRVSKPYTGRITKRVNGKQEVIWWCGRFATKSERDQAVALANATKPWLKKPSEMTVDDLIAEYVTEYAKHNKASSLSTCEERLKRLSAKLGSRLVTEITRDDAREFAKRAPVSNVDRASVLFNYAVDELEIIDRNPFRKMHIARTRGRRDRELPTVAELELLLDSCDALGEYGPQFRDFLEFASLTLMRPGELYELRYGDVDLAHNRITVARRLYRGHVDKPKSNRAKMIALVPPARDILLRQPTRTRDDGLVFVSKNGCRLSAPIVSQYFSVVRAAAKLPTYMDLYLCTKHFGVSKLYQLGLSARAIGVQAGWSESAVDALLAVYGHKDLAALSEVDALYSSQSDASKPHKAAESL